ncbi:MAG TPA: SRPBCC family protein [Pseudonocardia sp.]|uniref:SRPBCC family protein n=1 Tax=Pseudonocardia sp. TaxID=60912 RepID=UPI002CEA493A|nr:SRPBCC family protein [Pseudonocardia sp.]HTF50140.1 SRPBCC family protein [Pseudonocardia sp.]
MIHNVHQREFRATEDQLGALLDQVAEPGGLWPSRWPPLVLDRPLGVGADGGHGPIRYQVVDYQPGRRAVFKFQEPTDLDGTHTLEVLPGSRPGTAVLRHELTGQPRGLGLLNWTLLIRRLHDALLEDLLDRAGHAVGDPPARPARWSVLVRMSRGLLGLRADAKVTD